MADDGSTRLVWVDFATGSQHLIGRTGRGPGEYMNIAALTPVGPRRTLAADPYLRRWLVLEGRDIASTLSPGHQLTRAVGVKLSGGDERGRVLAMREVLVPGTGRRIREDSAVLVLADFPAGAVDTIARLRGLDGAVHLLPANWGPRTSVAVTDPFASKEQAILFPDGWVAIARLEPFRVEWHDTQGRIHIGPVVEAPLQRVGESQKQMALRAHEGSAYYDALRRAIHWPSYLPPFGPDALLADPAGNLVVNRLQGDPSSPRKYDVFDRRGVRVRTVSFQVNERLVGVGVKHAYVVTKGEDDVETLRRIVWP